MRSALFIHILSAFIAYAAADCCWADNWSATSFLFLKWDAAAGVVRCGLSGVFPRGTKCTVENSKDANGNIQALTNVTFGSEQQPFQFRIGIDPGSCDPLPNDKVVTGWEGWGAYLFKGDTFTSQRLEVCTQEYSA
ncbi:hypothetical protein LZ30DRAFT_707315 [Colletotrichum cereale]|nr:hypothetical protein LZ30DRAFT_707315 [Colletotrichum cereale]